MRISGKNLGLELGIPGTNGPDVRQSGLPIFYISWYENYGNPYSYMPKYVNDNSVTVSTNAGWQKGVHDIRFGLDLTRKAQSLASRGRRQWAAWPF